MNSSLSNFKSVIPLSNLFAAIQNQYLPKDRRKGHIYSLLIMYYNDVVLYTRWIPPQ